MTRDAREPPAAHARPALNEQAHRIDDATFRYAMGQFPTGVTVVAAIDPQTATVHGMTANAFVSVSMEPALVLVSIGGATRTHQLLENSLTFGVSILREGQERVALQFAGRPVGLEPFEFVHQESGPVLRDCLVSVCAEVVSTVRAGDHTLFIAAITRIDSVSTQARPLTYHRGRFMSLGSPTGDWPIDIADAWAGSLRSGWG